jgi:hypothetical protein
MLPDSAASQCTPCPHEGILQCLLRILAIAQHMHGISSEPGSVPTDQDSVGIDIAVQDTPDEGAVRLLRH